MKTSIKTLILSSLLLVCLLVPSGLALAANSDAKTINGDQFVLGQSFTLAAGDTLNGSLIVIGGTVTTDAASTINGDLIMIGGTVSIGGKLTGSIVCVGGTGSVADTAIIEGDVVSAGGWLNISPKAQVKGTTNINTPSDFRWNFGELFNREGNFGWVTNPVNRVLTDMFKVLALAALAALIVLIFAKPTGRVGDTISSSPALSWGVGLLTVLVTPVLVVVMAVTLILIPAIPLVILLLVLAFVFGYIALGYEIGRKLETASKGQWAEPVSAGIGMLILGLVTTAIGWIPCLGWVVNAAITLFGLGAIVLTRFGTHPYPEMPKVPAAVIPPVPPASPVSLAAPVVPVAAIKPAPVTPPAPKKSAPAEPRKPAPVAKAAPKKPTPVAPTAPEKSVPVKRVTKK